MAPPPTREEIDARLKKLREFRSSSYRGYAGYEKLPKWLSADLLLKRAGGDAGDGATRYRAIVEERVKQGVAESDALRLKWGLVLGGERFARKVRKHVDIGRETCGRKELARWVCFEDAVRVVERLKKEKWDDFRGRRGDAGRDLVLWACRQYGGMSLKEIGQKAGGLDYSAVAVAILRLKERAEKNREISEAMKVIGKKCQM